MDTNSDLARLVYQAARASPALALYEVCVGLNRVLPQSGSAQHAIALAAARDGVHELARRVLDIEENKE